jgi:ABC-type lipoprotein export system ATPase subunit
LAGNARLNSNPKIILADEPTASLDTDRALSVMHLLRQVSSESRTAVLAVTHHHRLVGEVDRVITMMDGRIAEPNGLKPGPEARIGETFPPIPANH